MHISPDTIYTSLYILPKGAFRAELLSCLRQGHQRRHRRRALLERPRKPLADMVSIVERPVEANDRMQVGHWEGDVLVGRNRQSVLGTLVERSTRLLRLVPLKSKAANEVCAAFGRTLKRIPRYARRTLTYDQGREMAEHRRLTARTKVRVYFAHPASPWERGTSEQTNGLVRQFFPKATDFRQVTRSEIARVERLMNGRPRKVLDYRTPDEAWQEALR
jgi:IS30 family transposase